MSDRTEKRKSDSYFDSRRVLDEPFLQDDYKEVEDSKVEFRFGWFSFFP